MASNTHPNNIYTVGVFEQTGLLPGSTLPSMVITNVRPKASADPMTAGNFTLFGLVGTPTAAAEVVSHVGGDFLGNTPYDEYEWDNDPYYSIHWNQQIQRIIIKEATYNASGYPESFLLTIYLNPGLVSLGMPNINLSINFDLDYITQMNPTGGCLNSSINIGAIYDDGSCPSINCNFGCTDSTAHNYDPAATCDNGLCDYSIPTQATPAPSSQATPSPASIPASIPPTTPNTSY